MVTNSLRDLLVSSGAIKSGDFTLASGRKSKIYIDIKKAITDPHILRVIATEVLGKELPFDAVAGVAVGGVPLAVAVSLGSEKPYIIIRKEQKGHGLSDLCIGDTKGRKILLIEDATTSGGSAVFGIEQIRNAGGDVNLVVTVVDRNEGAAEKLSEMGIRLIPLISMQELISD
ncbi:MAG: orotate phosphoribosyltransferase [Methanospirillum sp.]|nr:orotate phosphoribosyltransferase [Methanospirillum sp.]